MFKRRKTAKCLCVVIFLSLMLHPSASFSTTVPQAKAAGTKAKATKKTIKKTTKKTTKENTEAEAVSVAKRGSELTVTERDGDWCRVSQGGVEGYVMASFLTDSREEAQSAVEAQEVAEEAARIAAEQASQSGQPQDGGRNEVSRQNFDDCDGSGHGYTIITYSDGSTETVEY